VLGVSVLDRCVDIADQGVFVGDPSIQALGGNDAQLGLGQIELTAVLWGVVPLEALSFTTYRFTITSFATLTASANYVWQTRLTPLLRIS
jgi:hypothetical protein